MEKLIKEIIEKPLNHMGFKTIRIKLGQRRKNELQVMAERLSDGKLSIDDCVKISRHISSLLEVDDRIESDYLLEVSSPGIERPLLEPKDYEKFSGNQVRVKLSEKFEGFKSFTGELKGIDANKEITFLLEHKSLIVPFDSIIECSLKSNI